MKNSTLMPYTGKNNFMRYLLHV